MEIRMLQSCEARLVGMPRLGLREIQIMLHWWLLQLLWREVDHSVAGVAARLVMSRPFATRNQFVATFQMRPISQWLLSNPKDHCTSCQMMNGKF